MVYHLIENDNIIINKKVKVPIVILLILWLH